MAKYTHTPGGVGAPVGLTVFKTAGGSLGAAPDGFDSHTPLPLHKASYFVTSSTTGTRWDTTVHTLFIFSKSNAGYVLISQ